MKALSKGLRDDSRVNLIGWPIGLYQISCLLQKHAEHSLHRWSYASSHTVSISTIELTDGFFRILFLLVGYEGDTLRTILAIIAQLESRNGTDPLEQFLVLW